ncbi:DUF2975 domain-containing protein [Salinicoccus kekensis]|uniref:DUF2975 family protein n=1 Tax=Salinicoccus kekensis TaxID=714307 RepID=A0A285USY5_9STAP|nr:DUF2975 domain-containing protein [Salinicoccus kekensis]SOC44787.1 hypothetical protein SAMN05878391_2473 [Salinicoccus kekensis]
MRQVSTLFLKVAVIALRLPVLALYIFVLPQFFSTATTHAGQGETLGFIFLGILIVMYITIIPFFFALYQTLKLLGFIEKDQAFSRLSVTALKKIKNSAKVISILYLVILPLVYIVAEWDDAPGLVLVGMVMVGAPFAIAVFASVLQRLLQSAIDMKEENELTI